MIALHVHGPGMFHATNKFVKAPGDLRGMKVRGPTRQITKMLGALGATPVGMPLPQIPDALSKGTIEACVIPWEVVPSVKVHELTKFHTEFPATGPALYTTTFVMAMNKAKYNSLPPDLKKIIDNNSGLATSAWLGKVQQGNDPIGRKTAADRGNTIFTVSAADAQEFRRKSRVALGCFQALARRWSLPGPRTPRLVFSFTCTGIMRGPRPRWPATAVARSCSMVPIVSPPGTLIFQDWYRLGKTEYT